jgi:hypothetical protein
VIRYSIPAAAILLGLVVSASRPKADQVASPKAVGAAPARGEMESPRPAAEPADDAGQVRVSEKPPQASPASAGPLPDEVLEPHKLNRPTIVALLERELSLSPAQRRRVEEAFLRREREIDAHHRQIREVGAFSGEAYHRHMQELRASSYREVGQALDAPQHRRFLELVAGGSLNDVIGFPLEEGMVELD